MICVQNHNTIHIGDVVLTMACPLQTDGKILMAVKIAMTRIMNDIVSPFD